MDSRVATAATSGWKDKADFQGSDDAEELRRSSIFTDRFKKACARASRAFSAECPRVEEMFLAFDNAAMLRLDFIGSSHSKFTMSYVK